VHYRLSPLPVPELEHDRAGVSDTNISNEFNQIASTIASSFGRSAITIVWPEPEFKEAHER